MGNAYLDVFALQPSRNNVTPLITLLEPRYSVQPFLCE